MSRINRRLVSSRKVSSGKEAENDPDVPSRYESGLASPVRQDDDLRMPTPTGNGTRITRVV